MLLKQSPQDFIVNEIPLLPKQVDNGQYAIVKLTKMNQTTRQVTQALAQELNIAYKDIGIAGLKDKIALTTQYISVRHINKQQLQTLHIPNTTLEFVYYANAPLTMGQLQANEFIITIRKCAKDIQPLTQTINYFGAQRFSKNNWLVGQALIKQDYKQVCALLQHEDVVAQRLAQQPTDCIGAVRTIAKPQLVFYIASYQSFLWNKMAALHVQQHPHFTKEYAHNTLVFPKAPIQNIQLPLVGFATHLTPNIQELVHTVLQDENITLRSFVNRTMPECSSAGDYRDLILPITNMHIKRIDNETVRTSFTLPKGAYATTVIDALSL